MSIVCDTVSKYKTCTALNESSRDLISFRTSKNFAYFFVMIYEDGIIDISKWWQRSLKCLVEYHSSRNKKLWNENLESMEKFWLR